MTDQTKEREFDDDDMAFVRDFLRTGFNIQHGMAGNAGLEDVIYRALQFVASRASNPVAWTSESWLSQTRQGLEGYITGTKRAGFDVPLFTHPQGWQPIETAPKDEVIILADFGAQCLLTGAPHVWTSRYCTGAEMWLECSYAATNENGEPTHWFPLPAAPDKGSRA